LKDGETPLLHHVKPRHASWYRRLFEGVRVTASDLCPPPGVMGQAGDSMRSGDLIEISKVANISI
jgi:hypothetical protein